MGSDRRAAVKGTHRSVRNECATSRPRAWGDVVDLAGRRLPREPDGVAVAATSRADDTPTVDGAAVAAAGNALPFTSAGADPSPVTLAEAVDPTDLSAASPSLDAPPVPADHSRTPRGHRRERLRQSATRRVRRAAAGLLHRAEQRLRPAELEPDRS